MVPTRLRIPLAVAHRLPGLACAALALAPLVPSAHADELGVLLGHTWTRAELLAPPVQGEPPRLRTGHCFTITVPYVHTLRGPWAWSTGVTVFHPDFTGRAVSTAEIPFALRWTGRAGGVRPFLEAGPALSWGAGMTTGHEHTVEWSATLDACAGVTAPVGDEAFTLAVRTLNRPQDGVWARRVALQAGVTRRVLGPGDRGPDGEPPHPRRVGRTGSLLEGAWGVHRGRLEIVALGGFETRGGTVSSLHGDGHTLRTTSTRFSGALSGVSASYGGEMALRVSALYGVEAAHYDYALDGATVATSRASWSGLTVPVQFQLSPFPGAVRPYMAIGPALTFRLAHEAPRSEAEVFTASTGIVLMPGPGQASFYFPLAQLLHPTAGVEVRARHFHVRVEARATTSPLDDHATTLMYLAGVRLTP